MSVDEDDRRWHPTLGPGVLHFTMDKRTTRFVSDGGVTIPLPWVESRIGRPGKKLGKPGTEEWNWGAAMTDEEIERRLLNIPTREHATINGLVVERGNQERWVINAGLHGYWTDLDGAADALKKAAGVSGTVDLWHILPRGGQG